MRGCCCRGRPPRHPPCPAAAGAALSAPPAPQPLPQPRAGTMGRGGAGREAGAPRAPLPFPCRPRGRPLRPGSARLSPARFSPIAPRAPRRGLGPQGEAPRRGAAAPLWGAGTCGRVPGGSWTQFRSGKCDLMVLFFFFFIFFFQDF